MVLNSVFPSNTLLLYFFLDLKLLITAVIAQNIIPTAELAIPPRIPVKKGKAEMETYQVTVEAKISKSSV